MKNETKQFILNHIKDETAIINKKITLLNNINNNIVDTDKIMANHTRIISFQGQLIQLNTLKFKTMKP